MLAFALGHQGVKERRRIHTNTQPSQLSLGMSISASETFNKVSSFHADQKQIISVCLRQAFTGLPDVSRPTGELIYYIMLFQRAKCCMKSSSMKLFIDISTQIKRNPLVHYSVNY